jgi:hypothetical protein
MKVIYFLSAIFFAMALALPVDERRSNVLAERQVRLSLF